MDVHESKMQLWSSFIPVHTIKIHNRRDENKYEVKKKNMKIGADSTLWFYYILLSKKKLVTKSVPILFRTLMAVKPIQSWDYPQQGIYPIFLIQGSRHSRAITVWNTQSVISQQHAESLCVFGRVGEKHTPPSSPLSLHINHLHSGLIRVVYIMNPCWHPRPIPPSLNLPTSLPLTNRKKHHHPSLICPWLCCRDWEPRETGDPAYTGTPEMCFPRH